MDYDKLIEQLRKEAYGSDIEDLLLDTAIDIETLRAENERLREEVEHWKNGHHQAALNFQQENRECNKALADLARVTAERDGAKSPEVLEAVDELVEFARTRMCTADWLYYANVLGEWRGLEKED